MASSAVFVKPSRAGLFSIDYNYFGFLALLVIPLLICFCCYYRKKKNATPTYITGDEDRLYVKHQATKVEEINMHMQEER